MIVKKTFDITVAVILNLILLVDLEAATIEISCRVEEDRSKISVEGSGLPPGKYYAKVLSGGVWSRPSRPKAAVGRHVEFEFDSHDEAGATLIPANFIINGAAQGVIRKFKINRSMGVGVEDSCRIK